MADFESQTLQGRSGSADMSKDMGLRNFMLGIYVKMMLGLLLTGAIAWTIASVPAVNQYFFTHEGNVLTGFTLLGVVARWLPLIVLIGASLTRAITPRISGFIYWMVVTSIGIGGAVWFMVYNLGSIATIFFVTASAFGALSLYGYTTRRDLTGIGSFAIMALWGLIAAMLVNTLLLHSSGLDMAISAIGVLLFAGLTAFDTQKLKSLYYQIGGNQTAAAVATNMGALSLYLDFINLFTFLLRLGGSRR